MRYFHNNELYFDHSVLIVSYFIYTHTRKITDMKLHKIINAQIKIKIKTRRSMKNQKTKHGGLCEAREHSHPMLSATSKTLNRTTSAITDLRYPLENDIVAARQGGFSVCTGL